MTYQTVQVPNGISYIPVSRECRLNSIVAVANATPGATLHLTYQGNPPAIEPGTEIDDIIPAPFGSDLVEYYLCRECFSRIEDGIEGRKVNTDYYNGQFLQSFAALEAHIGTRDSEPQTIMDECGL